MTIRLSKTLATETRSAIALRIASCHRCNETSSVAGTSIPSKITSASRDMRISDDEVAQNATLKLRKMQHQKFAIL